MKYPKKLVRSYISGEEISEYDIDELENDLNFMIEAIRLSNDKNLYNLCSENIKTNPVFIKFIINNFKNDLEFISKVSEHYICKTSPKDIDFFEIVIILKDLFYKKKDDDFNKYVAKAEAIYLSNLSLIIDTLSINSDESIESGFLLLKEKYEYRDIIINYIASRLLIDLFLPDKDIKKYIYTNYKSKKDLLNYGINKIIIDYVNRYDRDLADYLCVNIKLIEPIKDIVSSIIKKWNEYIKLLNKKRLDIIYNELDSFQDENKDGMPIDYYGILYDIILELHLEDDLGLKEEITIYKEMESIFDNELKKDKYLPYGNAKGIIPLKETEFRNRINNLLYKLFKSNYIEDDYFDYDNTCSLEGNTNSNSGYLKPAKKIIKFKSYQKKH